MKTLDTIFSEKMISLKSDIRSDSMGLSKRAADGCMKIIEENPEIFEHPNEWINGQYFLRTMYFSQFHHKIFCLQREREKYVYEGTIEASPFRDDHGFKSYRLVVPVKSNQPQLE